jgi:mono/diheme cytochrome c family protein
MFRLAPITFLLLCLSPVLAAEPVDYVRDIKPILKERCYSCHGALKQKGSLRLDSVALMSKGGKSGAAVVAGKSAESGLIERVSDPDESTRMPPEGKPLTAAQIALVKAWIEQGAKGSADEKPEEDPRTHWAFRKPTRVEPPVARLRSGLGSEPDRSLPHRRAHQTQAQAGRLNRQGHAAASRLHQSDWSAADPRRVARLPRRHINERL